MGRTGILRVKPLLFENLLLSATAAAATLGMAAQAGRLGCGGTMLLYVVNSGCRSPVLLARWTLVRISFALLLFCPLGRARSPAVADDPDYEWYKSVSGARQKYLAELARALDQPYEVKLHLLAPSPPTSEAQSWSQDRGGLAPAWIQRSKLLEGNQRDALIKALQDGLRDPVETSGSEFMRRSFEPTHALVINSHSGHRQFECTLCSLTRSFVVSLPMGSFTVECPNEDLSNLLQRLLPYESKPRAAPLGEALYSEIGDFSPHWVGPMHEGSQWTVQMKVEYPYGNTRQFNVLTRVRDTLTFQGKKYSVCESVRQFGKVTHGPPLKTLMRRDESGVYFMEFSDVSRGEQKEAVAPMQAGQTWTSRVRGIFVNATVLGIDQIQIGRRTFPNCAHVLAETPDGNYREEYWTSPETGFVKSHAIFDNGVEVTSTIRSAP